MLGEFLTPLLLVSVLAADHPLLRTKRQFFGWPCPCNNQASKPCCPQPAYTNPCFIGRPILGPQGSPQFCGNDPNSCPSNYFCHYGAERDTTCCCQQLSGNPCAQPLNVGRGNAQLQRWYFNAQSGQCESFQYYGLAGNQNNFLTQEQCKQTCNAREPPKNPCSIGSPAGDMSGNQLQCGMQIACPAQYWCHIGATPETTVCCPRTGQECAGPESVGSGESQLQRWWYNENSRDCQSFIYRGLQGNENNYLTRDQCLSQCRKYINVCIQGQPLLIGTGQPQTCSRMQGCPVGYWCHIGASTDTTMCCPDVGDPCTLSQSPGMGTAQIQRWFYDSRQKMCATFVYAGIKGNSNNFLTKQDCENQCPVWENVCAMGNPLMQGNQPHYCSPQNLCPAGHYCHIGRDQKHTMCCQSTGDPCKLPLLSGFGQDSLPRYYYDTSARQCKMFTYAGMKGNENNFLSKSDCQTVCPVRAIHANACPGRSPVLLRGAPVFCQPHMKTTGCPADSWCHPGDSATTTMCCPGSCTNPCILPPIAGSGETKLARWFFDSTRGRCTQFTYSGAGGNCNNFLSHDFCMLTCPEVNPCQVPGQPLQQGGQVSQCQPTNLNSCPASHFCHPGATQADMVCCPNNVAGDRCNQPHVGGTGNLNLQRWYYSPALDECVPFTYRGSGGGPNNFISQQTCEQACPGMRGYCPHGRPLQVLGQPQTCSVESLCQNNYVCHVNTQRSVSVCCPDPTSFCFLPVDVGTCSERMERYHYDPASDTCVSFVWSGCGGNMNNFPSHAACTKLCCKEEGQPMPVPIQPNRFP